MSLAEFPIRNRLISFIIIGISILGGWFAYENMPRFEDPEFTIRTAVVITQYPGASPEEVANEVTEPLETALQQMQEVDELRSTSSAGLSRIEVDILYEFSPSKSSLQAIWTKLRSKVGDAQNRLPPGAEQSIVNDDFGDVYGLLYFLTGEGYTPKQLEEYAKDLRTEMLTVDGVAKVAIQGAQSEVIYVEISRERAASLGVSVNQIYGDLEKQNSVVSAGNVRIGERRLVIAPSGDIDSVEALGNTIVSTASEGTVVYLRDIATIRRDYQDPASSIFRWDGKPAIAIGVSNVTGGNVAAMGAEIDRKVQESDSLRPVGIEIHEYYHQGKIVNDAVANFALNVVAALAIVLVTLFLFMGLKSAIVIGAVLLLTIAATLLTMYLGGIPMHRISLGALIIALGMLVDNAIVVTDGILVGVQKGRSKIEMAKEVVAKTKWPLLGGTLVGIIAFAPIGLAPGDTAEFTGHLFWVVMISLIYSWIFAVTAVPLFADMLFKEGAEKGGGPDGKLMAAYKRFMHGVLKARWLTVGVAVGLFVVSVFGFSYIKPGFFPASTTPQVVVDYWLPEGTDIEVTAADMTELEGFVRGLDGVEEIVTLIGAGAPRYMLVYASESGNSAYGQFLLKVDYDRITELIPQIQAHIDQNFPNAQAKVWQFQLGPGGGSKVEAEFSGPDPIVLRDLANQAKAIFAADGGAISIKDNWRDPVSVIEPRYSEARGRRVGVSREDLATTLATNFSGRTVGVYREEETLIPIVARAPAAERQSVDAIGAIQVPSQTTGGTVPLIEVVDGFDTVWRDGQLRRLDRVPTIKAQADPQAGDLPSELLSRVRADIQAIELPDGYSLTWRGEEGNSADANSALASTLPLGFAAMVLVVVLLFNALRQPLVIWLVVPLALIGVVFGLLVTDLPFEFMAILGLLSLSGLLIKNAIVLVDQMDLEIRDGKARFDAVIDSAASRVRPVLMGASTTVLGVIPLFWDAFFKSMSVVLVFGLSFATVLTLIVVPALYAIFFRIGNNETTGAAKGDTSNA